MAKEDSLKVFIVGEVLRASHLNQLTENVGAVQYLAPWTASLTKDSSGVVFLGTTSAPFGGLVFKSGYKMLETADNSTTTEITLSGGGGGSGISTIEMKSHQEKLGNNFPISEELYLNEPYTNTDQYNMRLGKSYGTGDLSVIYLHPNYQSISKCGALADGTGNWTSLGAQAGAAVVGGTTFIEGNSAIYTTVSATTGENGLRFKLGTNTIALNDGKLRYALWLSTLTNISTVRTKLTTSAGTAASSWWDLTAQASGSALISGWNFMEVNPAGTASGSAGSYEETATKEIHVLITPTSSQSFIMAVDDVCSVRRDELWLPDVWQIADTNNTQLLHIASGNNGRYLLGTTVLNNYAIETTSISKKIGVIDSLNNTYYFPNGTGSVPFSGALAKDIWCINTKHFNQSFLNKTLNISSRSNSPEYKIIDVPSATSLKLKTITGTGDALRFTAGDTLRIYTKKWNGIEYNTPINSTWGYNFKDLTISGSTSVSGSELTINHIENNSGADANGEYYAVKVAKQIYYRAENNNQGQSLIKFTPTVFMPKEAQIQYPAGIHSHWKLDDSGNAINAKILNNFYDLSMVGSVPYLKSGKCGHGSRGIYTASNYLWWNANGSGATAYDSPTFFVEGWFKTNVSGAYQHILAKADGAGVGTGWTLYLNNSNQISFGIYGPGALAYTGKTYTDGQWHYVFAGVRNTSGANEIRIYMDGDLVAQSTGATFTKSTQSLYAGVEYITGGGPIAYPMQGYLTSLAYWDVVTSTWGEVEQTIKKRWNNGIGAEYGNNAGFIEKGSIANQSGQKLTLATRLKISDTVIENTDTYDLETDALLS